MRDGIYKDLPLPRPWKGLLRSCAREAERGEPARARARRAVATDANREIGAGFLRQLQRRAEERGPQLPGLSAFDGVSSSRDLQGRNTPLENLVVDHARRLEQRCLDPRTLAVEATAAALADWNDRNLRHMAQHCMKAGPEARESLAAAREALSAQNLREIAEQRVAGERPRLPAARPIDLDEDLASPR